MNEKGFGNVDVIAFIFVLLLSITIVSVLYNQLETEHPSISSDIPMEDYSKETSTEEPKEEEKIEASSYQELEDKVAKKSIPYFENNSTESNLEVVTIQTLVQNEYIPTIYSLKDSKVDCTGYVEYDKVTETYTTYLRCGELYETNGYDVTKEVNGN